jgi:hypothetical protein
MGLGNGLGAMGLGNGLGAMGRLTVAAMPVSCKHVLRTTKGTRRMIAFLRLIGLVLVVELIFYALISIYVRSLRRESLEKEWDLRHPERAGPSEERDIFVRRSMRGFSKTLRARLVGLVLVLPMIVIVTIIVFVNYN